MSSPPGGARARCCLPSWGWGWSWERSRHPRGHQDLGVPPSLGLDSGIWPPQLTRTLGLLGTNPAPPSAPQASPSGHPRAYWPLDTVFPPEPCPPWGLSVKPHSPLPRPPPPPGRGRINVCTDFRASGICCVLAARCGFHAQWGSLSPLVGGWGVRTLLSLVDPGPYASRPFPVLVITASSQAPATSH